MKRRNATIDSLTVAAGGFTAHERSLRKTLRKLIRASDELTSQINLDFPGTSIHGLSGDLMDATSAAEKALKGGAA